MNKSLKDIEKKLRKKMMHSALNQAKQKKHLSVCPKCKKQIMLQLGSNVCPFCNAEIDFTIDVK